MSELFVREAHFNDKDEILNIIENFNEGLDYLHEYFDYFQECQNISTYICETGNQTIGYVACHRVDDGETIVTRAARVRPDYQGRGVYRHMLAEIEAMQKEKRTFQRFVVIALIPPTRLNLQKYFPVARKEAHAFEFTRRQLVETSIRDIKGFDEILQTLGSIPAAFLSEPYSSYLFPEKRIIVDSVPLRIIEGNLKEVSGRNNVFVTDVNTNTTGKLKDVETPQVRGLLTASAVYQMRDFAVFVLLLDVFGSDLDSLNNHVAYHLTRLENSESEHVHLQIFTSKDCNSSVIDDTLSHFGKKRLTEGPRLSIYNKLDVYEKQLIMSIKRLNVKAKCHVFRHYLGYMLQHAFHIR